jgi:hypothetical protein
MPLDRESILKADTRRGEMVAVPEWGGVVWVRSLSGTDRDLVEQAVHDARKGGQPDPLFSARVVALSAHDEGHRLFKLEDAPKLAEQDAGVLKRIADVALRLSGMDGGAAERAEGNSPPAPSASSTTA